MKKILLLACLFGMFSFAFGLPSQISSESKQDVKQENVIGQVSDVQVLAVESVDFTQTLQETKIQNPINVEIGNLLQSRNFVKQFNTFHLPDIRFMYSYNYLNFAENKNKNKDFAADIHIPDILRVWSKC